MKSITEFSNEWNREHVIRWIAHDCELVWIVSRVLPLSLVNFCPRFGEGFIHECSLDRDLWQTLAPVYTVEQVGLRLSCGNNKSIYNWFLLGLWYGEQYACVRLKKCWLWLVVDAAFFFITAAMNSSIKYCGNVLLSLSTVSVIAALVGCGW